MELLIVPYFFIFVFGVNLGISGNFYNELRVLEVLLLLIINIFTSRYYLFCFDYFIFLLVLVGFFVWNNPYFIILDLLVLYLLCKATFLLDYNKLITTTIVLSSFFIFIFFPISIFDYVVSGIYKNWYPLPWNIRVYNSYFLITSIFAVWLFLTSKKYNYIYLIFIFLAFLSVLLDGGRSVTVAYTVFIATIYAFNSRARFKLLAIYAFTWFFYYAILYFAPHSGLRSITRESTSGRYDLWFNAFQCWVKSPIIGCGFYQLDYYPNLSAHPHNLFIQVLTETGLIGFSFLCLIVFKIAKNISWDIKENYFVLAALFAVVIDLSFSGTHIYPITQIALLWLFVFLLKNPEFSHAHYFNHIFVKKTTLNIIFHWAIYLVLISIFSYLILNTSVLSENLPSTPPRFWEFGYKLF